MFGGNAALARDWTPFVIEHQHFTATRSNVHHYLLVDLPV